MPNDASLLLDDADPAAILVESLAMFERACLASSLGPQSLVILDLLTGMGRSLPVLFLDTGEHFPETLSFLERVERRYGIAITRVVPESPVAGQWSTDPDACCANRKVEPLRRALRPFQAWITGIRRDQTANRAAARAVDWDLQFGLWKVNPMVRWSRTQVDAYLHRHDVPSHPLLAEGYTSIGCRPCTGPADDERAGRWAGSAKTECGLHLTPRRS